MKRRAENLKFLNDWVLVKKFQKCGEKIYLKRKKNKLWRLSSLKEHLRLQWRDKEFEEALEYNSTSKFIWLCKIWFVAFGFFLYWIENKILNFSKKMYLSKQRYLNLTAKIDPPLFFSLKMYFGSIRYQKPWKLQWTPVNLDSTSLYPSSSAYMNFASFISPVGQIKTTSPQNINTNVLDNLSLILRTR